ncbi:MAG: hypothetical protein LBV47_01145 [Bacteroidales bacterium]|jgi:hypothetical protein|nr:hypothetical protein [Bacteroidales bacterium]
MKIYDYLFYKTYILAEKSRNFEGIPVLGGIIFVGFCVVMNVGAIVMLAEGFGINVDIDFGGWHKYPLGIGTTALLLFYYYHKGRYRKIIGRYEAKAAGRKKIHPLIVIAIYYVSSFGLALLTGLFKNKDWIFAP